MYESKGLSRFCQDVRENTIVVRFDPTPRFHLRSLVILIAVVTLLILGCWWINSNITDAYQQQKINIAPTETNSKAVDVRENKFVPDDKELGDEPLDDIDDDEPLEHDEPVKADEVHHEPGEHEVEHPIQ